MIGHLRLVAAGLMFAVVTVLGSVRVQAAPVEIPYACERGQQSLSIRRDRHNAHVRFGHQTFELRRRDSGIGEKYMSDNAALIVDGATAIFVVEEPLQLGTCTETHALASTR